MNNDNNNTFLFHCKVVTLELIGCVSQSFDHNFSIGLCHFWLFGGTIGLINATVTIKVGDLTPWIALGRLAPACPPCQMYLLFC